MITEHDLREAIAECEGARNPSTSTCIKLAALYAILDRLYGENDTVMDNRYSYDSGGIRFSNTEFSKIVEEKGIEMCYPVIDDLMTTLYVINPALYRSVIRKLTEI